MKKKFLAAVMALVMIGTTPVGVFADTMVKSYLTGLDVPESEGRVRPVAVMLNNIKQGCPQSGIANAGVVYEAPLKPVRKIASAYLEASGINATVR